VPGARTLPSPRVGEYTQPSIDLTGWHRPATGDRRGSRRVRRRVRQARWRLAADLRAQRIAPRARGSFVAPRAAGTRDGTERRARGPRASTVNRTPAAARTETCDRRARGRGMACGVTVSQDPRRGRAVANLSRQRFGHHPHQIEEGAVFFPVATDQRQGGPVAEQDDVQDGSGRLAALDVGRDHDPSSGSDR